MISLVIAVLIYILLNGVISHEKCGYDVYKQKVLAEDNDGSIHRKLNHLKTNFESERHKHTFNRMVRRQGKNRRELRVEGYVDVIMKDITSTYMDLYTVTNPTDLEITAIEVQPEFHDEWISGVNNNGIYRFDIASGMVIFIVRITYKDGAETKPITSATDNALDTRFTGATIRVFMDEWDGVGVNTGEYFKDILEIPVIVHILYNPSANKINELITYERIQSQILRLNTDYSGANTEQLALNWNTIKANYNIVFKLSEIRRVESTVPKFDWDNDQYKYSSQGGSDNVDAKHYLNLYIAVPVDSQDYLGMCTFPGSGSDSRDGCVINPPDFGDKTPEFINDEKWKENINDEYNLGRTATHEVGHWFFLEHTFGSQSGQDNPICTDNDQIFDIPNQAGPNFGCPTTINDFTDRTSCETKDMYQNYMDYSDDQCMALFTNGQLERTLSIFKLSYEDGGRKELVDYQNTMGNDRYVNDLYFVVSSQAIESDDICGPHDVIIPNFKGNYNDKYVYGCASTTNNPYVNVISSTNFEISSVNSGNNCLQIIEEGKYLCYTRSPFTDTVNRMTVTQLQSKLYGLFSNI